MIQGKHQLPLLAANVTLMYCKDPTFGQQQEWLNTHTHTLSHCNIHPHTPTHSHSLFSLDSSARRLDTYGWLRLRSERPAICFSHEPLAAVVSSLFCALDVDEEDAWASDDDDEPDEREGASGLGEPAKAFLVPQLNFFKNKFVNGWISPVVER